MGYDTVVGERGLTLSGGQRQRLALARALLTDPRILLLDDATSSVDVRLEEEIHATFRELMAGRTTLLVAHRRSTLHLADRIVLLDGGEVVDAGTHDELVDRCKLYRELLAGPGDDLETVTPEDPVVVSTAGVTTTAWQQPADDTTIAAARRAAYAKLREGMGGGGGGMGGVGSPVASRRRRRPSCSRPSRRCRRSSTRPASTSTSRRRPQPDFSLRRLLAPQGKRLALAAVLVGANALAMLAGPFLIRLGVDHGVTQDDLGWVWLASGLFVGSVAVTRALSWVVAIVTGRLGQEMLLSLRLRIFSHLQRLGLDFYDREMAGRIMTRMTSDVEALQSLLQTGFIDALVQLVTFVGVLAILFTMNVKLALAVLVIVPPLVLATLKFRSRSEKAYDRVRDRVAAVNANFQESISGVRVAQAFVREGRNVQEFQRVAGEHRGARLEGTMASSTYFPFVELLSAIATVLVLGVGSGMVKDGSLTTGALIAFVLYLTTVFAPIQQLSQVFDTYQQGRAALKKISDLLGTPVGTPAASSPVVQRLQGAIDFEDVSFQYATATSPALSHVSLSIRSGETMALVGETGAGKSTIVKLVARFYDPTSGIVRVDGVPLVDLDLEHFRQQLGYVPQEAFLFSGTVRDNIAYGRPAATDAEVEAAARAVGAHDFIARLPGGYHQPVVERGRSLSAGQRQLIALARAYLVDPAVLILDEATANLDLATESRVVKAMGVVSEGRTTLLIAHRLQSAQRADRIAVVDGGTVVELGSHDELLAADGAYARLWRTYTGEAATADAVTTA